MVTTIRLPSKLCRQDALPLQLVLEIRNFGPKLLNLGLRDESLAALSRDCHSAGVRRAHQVVASAREARRFALRRVAQRKAFLKRFVLPSQPFGFLFRILEPLGGGSDRRAKFRYFGLLLFAAL